ncbi:hypothetical protein C0Q70_06400 [Pomacea canaliculata]|uniref:Polymerase nucleotidyl transferase domain-containing protein n=1 Tax=Pomacea canaliculata TaxID=400727 RepID=A0A2T7PNW8_POMCA|nr:hypothetical protein C0Q70_06400 [Pomacea canaliculata]
MGAATMHDTRSRGALYAVRFRSKTDDIVRCLQQISHPYSVKKVIKSGSVGKGTTIRDISDIDLIAFFNDLTCIEDLIDERKVLLDSIQGALRRSLGLIPKKRDKYILSYMWDDFKVDIAPAFDVLSEYESPFEVYQMMEEYPKKVAALQFSASLAPLQVSFVKPVPEQVKKVIRLLKVWKDENDLGIRSYSIEILTIYIWSKKCEDNPGTDHLFREVMRQLATCGTLCVALDDNYKSSRYTRYMRQPYILDPANPYMNTLHGVSIGTVSECAKRTLRSLNLRLQEW